MTLLLEPCQGQVCLWGSDSSKILAQLCPEASFLPESTEVLDQNLSSSFSVPKHYTPLSPIFNPIPEETANSFNVLPHLSLPYLRVEGWDLSLKSEGFKPTNNLSPVPKL